MNLEKTKEPYFPPIAPISEISIRDLFAYEIMKSLIGKGYAFDNGKFIVADKCYEAADRMIAARNKISSV